MSRNVLVMALECGLSIITRNREYSLDGSYRKIVHLPTHMSWSHLLYSDPDLPLSQADEDILLSFPPPAVLSPDDSTDGNVATGQFSALRLNLTLGTSSYATMALREITKEDTSAHNQSQLTANAEDQKNRVVDAVEGEDEQMDGEDN